MKFTVEREALAEAVSWVARALPARAVLPVLTGLLLSAGPGDRPDQQNVSGFLTLSCFDYEVSARVRVPAEVAEPGTVLVPGRLLVEIVRSLPQHPVDFADDPDGVSVTCGDAAFMLTPLPLGEYPSLPELPQFAGTADSAALAAAIAQVTPAASRDDTLPMLTAVNVELDGTTMTLAATDRYRLAVRDLDWSPAPGLAGQGRIAFLVPARTLSEAARMIGHGDQVLLSFGGTTPRTPRAAPDGSAIVSGAQTSFGGTTPHSASPGGQPPQTPPRPRGAPDGSANVSGAQTSSGGTPPGGGYGAAEAMIGFESGERRLTARLLAGEFVRYRSRFPEEFGCTADLPADAFTEAVRRVALVAERGTPVQLSFAPGRVTVGAATQGQARARETVPADFTGDEPSIAFSPQYLLDGVVAATTTHPDEAACPVAQVRLRFTSPAKPAVITPAPGSGSDFRYLVVPQRVG